MAQEDISEELLPLLRYQAVKRGLTVRPDALFRLSEIERVMQRSFEHQEIESMVNECTNRHRNVPRFETATDKYGEIWIRAKYKVQLKGVERQLLEVPANICLAKYPPPLPPVLEAEAEGPAVNGWGPTRQDEVERLKKEMKTSEMTKKTEVARMKAAEQINYHAEAGRAEEKKQKEAGRAEEKEKKKTEEPRVAQPRGEDAKSTRSTRPKWEPRNPPAEVAERAAASGYRQSNRPARSNRQDNNNRQEESPAVAQPTGEEAPRATPISRPPISRSPWADYVPQTPPEETAQRASASGGYRPPHRAARSTSGGQPPQPQAEEAKPPGEDAKGPQPSMSAWGNWRPQTPPEEEEVIQGPPYVGSSAAGGANAAEGEEAAPHLGSGQQAATSSSWSGASDPVVERVHQRSIALQRQYELNEDRIDEQAAQIDEQRRELNELRQLVESLREHQEELRRWRNKDGQQPAAGNNNSAPSADGGKESGAPVGGWTRRQQMRKLRSKDGKQPAGGGGGSTPMTMSADEGGASSRSEAGQ